MNGKHCQWLDNIMDSCIFLSICGVGTRRLVASPTVNSSSRSAITSKPEGRRYVRTPESDDEDDENDDEEDEDADMEENNEDDA